jgi:hypothetical protein
VNAKKLKWSDIVGYHGNSGSTREIGGKTGTKGWMWLIDLHFISQTNHKTIKRRDP